MAPTVDRPLELLLLCDAPVNIADNVAASVTALTTMSRHRVRSIVAYRNLPLDVDVNRFDGVIVHWTIKLDLETSLSESLRRTLRRFSGLKIVFVQDDYRNIDAMLSAMRDLSMHAVLGLADREVVDRIYPPQQLPGVLREFVLPGYVPEEWTRLEVPAYRDRPIDVGYRGRLIPAWVGRTGRDKWLIGERFRSDAARFDLTCDISAREEDRIYGRRWIEFLSSCKAVLGVECSASVFDYSGNIQAKVDSHSAREPSASWEMLHDLYVKDAEEAVPMTVIPPRCFEAAALRTLMVLREGRYSGRLTPWRHYVPLRHDHSNMDEVVAVLKDHDRAQAIVDCAFQEVAMNPANSFAALAQQMDATIDRLFESSMAARLPAYTDRTFPWKAQARRARRRKVMMTLHMIVLRTLLRLPLSLRGMLYGPLQASWQRLLGFVYADGSRDEL